MQHIALERSEGGIKYTKFFLAVVDVFPSLTLIRSPPLWFSLFAAELFRFGRFIFIGGALASG